MADLAGGRARGGEVAEAAWQRGSVAAEAEEPAEAGDPVQASETGRLSTSTSENWGELLLALASDYPNCRAQRRILYGVIQDSIWAGPACPMWITRGEATRNASRRAIRSSLNHHVGS